MRDKFLIGEIARENKGGTFSRLLEIRRFYRHVAQVRGLKGSDIGLFPGEEKTAEH